ncbi:electron transport complex subunit RsxC [Martelella alba]|uniref:Ion-translocating oxidoreductase complex subunit C n=1 Tax=Martelella alba TaxID=2590451 RepID=A0ABY2SJV3_9HYPH|nr:electron transport complex subunit RsxC [Martelella alba]TKI05660.1 electron transport complex subunit RsxC [Martelella alba]
MFSLLPRRSGDRLWDFDGGITPPDMKDISSRAPLRAIPLPEELIIPLRQHLGPEGELRVAAGDHVLRGQPLSFGRGRALPVHAPTSGVIASIENRVTAHPSALAAPSIILRPDGEDRWHHAPSLADFSRRPPEELLERIQQSGIAGLGGAGFPTAAKMTVGAIDTLIVNAAECEPYITADDRLMRERAEELVTGIDIAVHIIAPRQVLIGIEDNKPEAADALRQALRPRSDYRLRVIPTKYPSGGARQLTRILTGREVPSGRHSPDIGVLMLNVGTLFAIKRAVIEGEALTERVVTLTGGALRRPGNVWARLGTPVGHLLMTAGFTPEPGQYVIMGGPLMGFALPTTAAPVVKITNCILVPSRGELGEERPEQSCIRCGRCADACPANLLPQQLYWFSRGQENDKARQYHLFDCIECGACAYVCPSDIPLVHYYRRTKAEIAAQDREAQKASSAKARHEAKLARREREKTGREERHRLAAARLAQPEQENPVANRGAAGAPPGEIHSDNVTDLTPLPATTDSDRDDRHAAVAAAIARVKARKAAGESAGEGAAPSAQDVRHAAVAAAIARVKARKAAAARSEED